MSLIDEKRKESFKYFFSLIRRERAGRQLVTREGGVYDVNGEFETGKKNSGDIAARKQIREERWKLEEMVKRLIKNMVT